MRFGMTERARRLSTWWIPLLWRLSTFSFVHFFISVGEGRSYNGIQNLNDLDLSLLSKTLIFLNFSWRRNWTINIYKLTFWNLYKYNLVIPNSFQSVPFKRGKYPGPGSLVIVLRPTLKWYFPPNSAIRH